MLKTFHYQYQYTILCIYVCVTVFSMCGTHICVPVHIYIPMSFKGRNHVKIRSKCNILNVVSRPKFHAISNGVLGFPVSWVLYAKNSAWIEAQFWWLVLSIFLYILLDTTAKTSAPLERIGNFGLETTWIFCIQLFLYAVSAPEEDGNIQANRYAYKHKQAVT